MTETMGPVSPSRPMAFWKVGMARMEVMSEPSYPLAQAQQKAVKMAK